MTKPRFKESRELHRLRDAAPGELSFVAFSGARYHVAAIERLLQRPPSRRATAGSGETDAGSIAAQDHRRRIFHWHVRGFFWELLGAFDMMLIWANDHFDLGMPVDAISCGAIPKKALKHREEWKRVRELLMAAWDSDWFFEIRTYRNFAHRSFVVPQALLVPGGTEMVVLPRAREGQLRYGDVRGHLDDYLKKMAELGQPAGGCQRLLGHVTADVRGNAVLPTDAAHQLRAECPPIRNLGPVSAIWRPRNQAELGARRARPLHARVWPQAVIPFGRGP